MGTEGCAQPDATLLFRSDSVEDLLSSRRDDRQDRGVLDPPLHRDGVKLLAYGLHAPDHLDVVAAPKLVFKDRRRWEDAFAFLAERVHESAVIEFRDQVG